MAKQKDHVATLTVALGIGVSIQQPADYSAPPTVEVSIMGADRLPQSVQNQLAAGVTLVVEKTLLEQVRIEA